MSGSGLDDRAAEKAGRKGNAGVRKHDWIARQLQRVYDEALDEEIPSDMLAILAKLDEPSTGQESPGQEDEPSSGKGGEA